MKIKILSAVVVPTAFLLALILNSCSAPEMMGEQEMLLSARETLLAGEEEGGNYGLYSYLLLNERPDSNNTERYRSVMERYLRFEPVEEYLETVDSSQINIVYLPVQFETDGDDNADSLLNKYDYVRSKQLLATLIGAGKVDLGSDGPFLVSGRVPLTDTGSSAADSLIIQDLTTVPPGLVEIWIDEFLKRSLIDRPWTEVKLRTFVPELRTGITVAAVGWPIVKEAVSRFITIFGTSGDI